MSAASITTIQKGLEVRLDQLNRSGTVRRPIAWENINFTPPATGLWWQTAFQPAMPVGLGMGEGGTKLYVGQFAVNVFQPRTGGTGGPSAAIDDAARIIDQFPVGGYFAYAGLTIHILSAGRLTGEIDQTWYFIPVRIRWQAWVDELG